MSEFLLRLRDRKLRQARDALREPFEAAARALASADATAGRGRGHPLPHEGELLGLRNDYERCRQSFTSDDYNAVRGLEEKLSSLQSRAKRLDADIGSYLQRAREKERELLVKWTVRGVAISIFVGLFMCCSAMCISTSSNASRNVEKSTRTEIAQPPPAVTLGDEELSLVARPGQWTGLVQVDAGKRIAIVCSDSSFDVQVEGGPLHVVLFQKSTVLKPFPTGAKLKFRSTSREDEKFNVSYARHDTRSSRKRRD